MLSFDLVKGEGSMINHKGAMVGSWSRNSCGKLVGLERSMLEVPLGPHIAMSIDVARSSVVVYYVCKSVCQ